MVKMGPQGGAKMFLSRLFMLSWYHNVGKSITKIDVETHFIRHSKFSSVSEVKVTDPNFLVFLSPLLGQEFCYTNVNIGDRDSKL